VRWEAQVSNAFLLLPEKLAKYPITLDEAAYQFGVGRLSDLERLDLSMDSRIKKGFYARRAVLLNLIGGELHAFVQDVEIGAWYRIPKRYWLPNGYDVEAAVAQPHLPETLDARPGIVLPGSGVLGQPIVVWREDVERAAEIIGVLGKAMNDRDAARLSPHGHKPSNGKLFNRMSPTREVEAWYKARVEAAPKVGYTRSEDEGAARDVGIGRDRLRSLRASLAPVAWKADGPKKGGH
jgi:hypothetical protein